MKTVAVLSFTDLARDPRVNRQLRFLQKDYHLIALGTASPKIDGVTFIALPELKETLSQKIFRHLCLLSRNYEVVYWQRPAIKTAFEKLQVLEPDLFIANDIDALPLCLKASRGAKVIYDAHEYAAREFEEYWKFRLLLRPYFNYLFKRYLSKSHGMMTVCQGLADEFSKEAGVRPIVITNAPDYEKLEPGLLEKGQKIKLIHHGVAIPSRKIEAMIDMMQFVDERFSLDLMLIPSDETYFDSLVTRAQNLSNICFRKPVAMRALAKTCNDYDIGIFILEPVNFNYKYALPNKFFEFVQGRLAIAIGPSIEMMKLVKAYDLGVVAEDFSPQALADKLNQLNIEDVNHFKQNAHKAAYELSACQNKITFLDVVRKVLTA